MTYNIDVPFNLASFSSGHFIADIYGRQLIADNTCCQAGDGVLWMLKKPGTDYAKFYEC